MLASGSAVELERRSGTCAFPALCRRHVLLVLVHRRERSLVSFRLDPNRPVRLILAGASSCLVLNFASRQLHDRFSDGQPPRTVAT
jgi:hypothetical protein